MRPGQNKRMRGRNNNSGGNNRKGPNPLTRSYESNGPDVKIRGTAHHIGEKYLQLARDAQSSGDPVMAESYLQHAEHYFRLIATAQQAQQQAAYGYQRSAGEQVEEDDGDDDYSLPDRFASPSERVAPPPPQPYEQRQPERHGYNGGDRHPGDRQPFEQRGDRPAERPYERQPHAGYAERQNDRHQHDGGERQDRPQQDRPQQDRQYNDRQQDRQQYDRNGRGYGDRPFPGRDGNRDANREAAREPAERQPQHQAYAPERVTPSERPFQAERPSPDRPPQDRQQDRQPRDQDRQPRDYDNRPRGRGPRAFRENGEGRHSDARQTEGHQPEPRQVVADEPNNGLPAFITAPTRVQPDPVASEPAAAPDGPRAKPTPPAVASEDAAPPSDGEDAGFLLRPRRRRRSKAEFAAQAPDAPPASDPVAE